MSERNLSHTPFGAEIDTPSAAGMAARARPFAEPCAWLLFAAVAWWMTNGFNTGFDVYRWGAASWPRAAILLIAVTALVQLVQTIRAAGAASSARAETKGTGTADSKVDPAQRLRLILIFILPVGYALMVPWVSYFIATPFFLVGYMWLFGQRQPRHLFGTSLLIYALILIVFSGVLYLPLPVGRWPGFYEVGTGVVDVISAVVPRR